MKQESRLQKGARIVSAMGCLLMGGLFCVEALVNEDSRYMAPLYAVVLIIGGIRGCVGDRRSVLFMGAVGLVIVLRSIIPAVGILVAETYGLGTETLVPLINVPYLLGGMLVFLLSASYGLLWLQRKGKEAA